MPAHRRGRSGIPAHRCSGPGYTLITGSRLGHLALNITMPSLLVPAVLFHTSQYTPSIASIVVVTPADGTAPFPGLELVLGLDLHKCIVNIRDEATQPHKFLIACQTGDHLAFNWNLQDLAGDAGWKGSMVIMQCDMASVPIGLHGTPEKDLAHRAAERFMAECNFSNSTNYPTEIWV